MMFDASTFSKIWHNHYELSPAESNIMISQESQSIVVAVYPNYFVRIFEVSLTDGTLKSAGVTGNPALTNSAKPILSRFGNSGTEFIISYPTGAGSNMIIWSTSTNSVVASHSTVLGNTDTFAIEGSQSNGMLYFTSDDNSANLNILKLYYYDPEVTNTQFSGTETLDTQSVIGVTVSDYSSISLSSTSFSVEDYPSLANTAISETQQVNSTNDVIYTNGGNQFHSVTSGYSGSLSFDYFCSKSEEGSFTTSLYDVDSENPVSSWLDIESTYTYLTISTAPTVTVDTNYSYGISYLSGENNMTSENIIGVYVCGVSNCAS